MSSGNNIMRLARALSRDPEDVEAKREMWRVLERERGSFQEHGSHDQVMVATHDIAQLREKHFVLSSLNDPFHRYPSACPPLCYVVPTERWSIVDEEYIRRDDGNYLVRTVEYKIKEEDY